jgi:hypothetical protein
VSDPKINDVPRADLEIHLNADLRFDVEWWDDEAETVPVPLADCLSVVKRNATEDTILLDIGAHTVVAGNVASVQVTPADMAAAGVEPLDRGVWDMVLVSVAGETKKVARGEARIHRGAA